MALMILLPSPALDDNGDVVVGAQAHVYRRDTLDRVSLFADPAADTPLPNPVIAPSNGRFPQVYYLGGFDLRVDILDGNGATLSYDLDPAPLVNPASSLASDALLDQIKSVDGPGSGLDADKLDGVELTTIRSEYNAASTLAKLKGVDGAGSGLDADLLDGTQLSAIAAEYTPAEILRKLKTVDGEGSGLDADALRGTPGWQIVDRIPVAANLGALTGRNNRFVTINSAANGVSTGTPAMTSPTDGTEGAVMQVGAFGLGVTTPPLVTNVNSTNLRNGYYRTQNPDGTMPPTNGFGVLKVEGSAEEGIVRQTYQGSNRVEVWTRYNSGSWSPWRAIYNQGTVVGAVSQSGGVPTGAIIERGSNSNGTYIRWADGTQICHSPRLTSTHLNNNALRSTWNFPATFAGRPVVTMTSDVSTLTVYAPTNMGAQHAVPSGDASNLGRLIYLDSYRCAGATSNVPVNSTMVVAATAIGVWY